MEEVRLLAEWRELSPLCHGAPNMNADDFTIIRFYCANTLMVSLVGIHLLCSRCESRCRQSHGSGRDRAYQPGDSTLELPRARPEIVPSRNFSAQAYSAVR